MTDTPYLTAIEDAMAALGRLAVEHGIPLAEQPPHIQAMRAAIWDAWYAEMQAHAEARLRVEI